MRIFTKRDIFLANQYNGAEKNGNLFVYSFVLYLT